jgi:hypothetical protein
MATDDDVGRKKTPISQYVIYIAVCAVSAVAVACMVLGLVLALGKTDTQTWIAFVEETAVMQLALAESLVILVASLVCITMRRAQDAVGGHPWKESGPGLPTTPATCPAFFVLDGATGNCLNKHNIQKKSATSALASIFPAQTQNSKGYPYDPDIGKA